MDRKLYDEVLAVLNIADETERRRHQHRLPLEQYSLSEHEYYFTICARQHGTPFTNPVLAQQVIDALLWYRDHYQWRLFCYCLMPDHLHFINQMTEDSTLTYNAGARGTVAKGMLDWVGNYKSFTTNQCWWKLGGCGKLWQKSSFDRVIRYNDSVDDAVNYVLNNPVRKGLVEEWTQYPFAAIVDEW